MKVLLKCTLVRQITEKVYLASFLPVQKNGLVIETTPIEIEFDCPVVPGTYYSILIKGKYPISGLSNPNTECVGDILSFRIGFHQLEGIDIQQEAELKKNA